MFRHLLLLLLALSPVLAAAQAFSSHKPVALDTIFDQWDGITKSYTPGLSVIQPQKVRFDAKYLSLPQPCNNRLLEMVFNSLAMPGMLNQLRTTYCIRLASASGREVLAWVQDVLVPGLQEDATLNAPIDVYADMLAYSVNADPSRNMPIMIVGRFEPKPPSAR